MKGTEKGEGHKKSEDPSTILQGTKEKNDFKTTGTEFVTTAVSKTERPGCSQGKNWIPWKHTAGRFGIFCFRPKKEKFQGRKAREKN